MGEKEFCNDPKCEKTREGIRHKYHGKEVKKRLPIGIRLKIEMASFIGITICSKCGTRTKVNYTDRVDEGGWAEPAMWKGYAICPKCGNKDKWLEDEAHAG